MNVELRVHSWISESLMNYLNNIGIITPTWVVDPDNTGEDIIVAVLPGGWSRKRLAERIEACNVPTSMFKIIA